MISNPRLTNSNVWFTDTGDIKLTVDIVDIEGSQIRCNLLVNGVEEGWTAYLDSPITLDFYISKDSLVMGDNSVVLNIEDTVGNVSTLSFLIVKEGKNTNPIVRILEFADEWSQGEKIEVVYGAGLQFKEGQVGQDYIVTGASQIRTEGKANISSVSIQGTNLDDVITNVNSIETMINRSSLGAGWVSEYSLDLGRFKAVNSIEVI